MPNGREAPARHLDNEVSWINPRLAESLPLKLGSADPSICFLIATATIATDTTLEVRLGHHRAGLNPGNRLFELVHFPYTDQKGVGDFTLAGSGNDSQLWETMHYVPIVGAFRYVRGLCDLKYSIHDAEMSEKMRLAGIRLGCEISSISRLKQIPAENKEGTIAIITETIDRPLSQLMRERSRVPFTEKFIPAIMTRHYAWPLRVSDLKPGGELKLLIDATIENASHELHLLLRYSDYLEWFCKTLARNVARLHKAGLTHYFLQSHNVTADCGIMDNDTVSKLYANVPFLGRFQRHRDNDHWRASHALGAVQIIKKLFNSFKSDPQIAASLSEYTPNHLRAMYFNIYHEELATKTESTNI